MGSEMCIRDRGMGIRGSAEGNGAPWALLVPRGAFLTRGCSPYRTCLLYTSDAADERSSVDLGGRRIIKKKKQIKHGDADNTRRYR